MLFVFQCIARLGDENEQKFTTFCDTVQHHFNETCPIDYAPRFGRSLETK